jgi:hypothetical protein
MFKKTVQVKPFTALRTSDVRKLQTDIQSLYAGADDASIQALLPATKAGVLQAKLTAQESRGTLYASGDTSQPLIIRLEDRLLPTGN